MLSLNRRIEQDRAAVASEAHAELDIPDPRDRLVEAAQLEERVAADRSEPGPERRCRPHAFMVDVVVEKVAEVGHQAAAVRLVIVGPEDR